MVVVTRRRRIPIVQYRALAQIEPVRARPTVVPLEVAPIEVEDAPVISHSELPLDRYRRQRLIGTDHWQAGLRLREDFGGGEFERLARCHYDGLPSAPQGDDEGDISVQSCLARKRYVAAMRALSPRLSPVIVHVCCLGQPVEEWAVLKRVSLSDGLSLLRKGLSQLVQHYSR
jgi:DNA-directed RNA polymerase specialized sigma24 family protein